MEIHFGKLEEAEPHVELRPDRNRHFAVLPVYAPAEEDLPIFVDLDALRDMELHALSDTKVELGGVLLGGQYYDSQGKPFVVISDSLRAQHYRATKGSFKFTHDTWEQISREREEFPSELQMVGWYHTHPDWTVFLSGMDMFICDNFFNKPLDVAFVIDPCGQDRGFFQWSGDPASRIRRTSGFYLTASRFRQLELAEFAARLEEAKTMAIDPRHALSGTGTSPVVHVNGGQPGWLTAAVLGTLAMQFCLLLVIAMRMTQPISSEAAAAGALTAIEQRLDDVASAERGAAEMQAQIQVLDQVLRQWDGVPDRLVSRLAERTTEVADLKDNLRAQRSLTAGVEAQIAAVESSLSLARQREEKQKREIESLRQEVLQLTAVSEALASPTENLDPLSDSRWTFWGWMTLAAVVGLICGGGIAVAVAGDKLRLFESESEDSPRATNNAEGEGPPQGTPDRRGE